MTAREVAARVGISETQLSLFRSGKIRGIRFSLGDPASAVVTADMVEPLSHRIADLGWHIQFNVDGAQVIEMQSVLRRLPLAYGAYTVAALALPLSFAVAPQPLMSLPRFLAVLFPIFMWLGTRRGYKLLLVASALLLCLLTARYATWHWVA